MIVDESDQTMEAEGIVNRGSQRDKHWKQGQQLAWLWCKINLRRVLKSPRQRLVS